MKDYIDRVPTYPNRYKVTDEKGVASHLTIERADEATTEGTVICRESLMKSQGFIGNDTVFRADGSIAETDGDGNVTETIFNADGSITEVFTGGSGLAIHKTTVFNADGSISEVIG